MTSLWPTIPLLLVLALIVILLIVVTAFRTNYHGGLRPGEPPPR